MGGVSCLRSGLGVQESYHDPFSIGLQGPPQKVRLDPPGTHPKHFRNEGTTGALGFVFLFSSSNKKLLELN